MGTTAKSESTSGAIVPVKSEPGNFPSKFATNVNKNLNGTNFSTDRLQTSSSVIHKQGYEYKGESDDIVFILTLPSENFDNKVIFSTFIDKLKNYVLTNFEGGKDLLPILELMKDPTPDVEAEEPGDLFGTDADSKVKVWMKQEEVKHHIKRLKNLQQNQEKLYAIIWGQLSHAMQEVVKGDDDFVFKDTVFDCIWLLQKCKLISAGVDGKANKHYNFVLALSSLCSLQQGITESNDSFRKRVDASALTLDLAGGSHVLCSPDLIVAVDENQITAKEINVEVEKMKAMIMFLKADPARYGTLHEDLYQSVYRGRDEFPTTVTATYDLLQHTSGKIGTNKLNLQERMSKFRFRRGNKRNFTFVQSNNREPVPGKDGKVYSHITCHNCNTPGHYSNQCPAKNDKVTLAHFSLTQKKLELINQDWILLDTCSTVSVFCNKSLVKDIKDCLPGDGITVVTNGGSEKFQQQGTLKLLPLNVHFNNNSIANIISLSDIANMDGAKLTMDTSVERAINVHVGDLKIQFKECTDGLYYYDTKNPGRANPNPSNTMNVTNYSTLVQTVHNNKQLYSKSDVQGADRARTLQEQLGWPSSTNFARIINNNLVHNSPVTIHDVLLAQKIYGTPTPLLKGHMIRTSPTKVRVQTSPLPQQIIQQHPTLQLFIDFFYVNQIPFLHTKCSTFGYLTAHGGVGRTLTAIKNTLDSVINLYESRGFTITDIHGDNEFNVKKLHDYLLPTIFHIYGRDEHVASIERSNRTVKERCRVICHSLPYKQYTKLMTLMLVEFVLYWVNAIPAADGFSKHTSPSTIVKGLPKPDFRHKHLAFGSYCMTYIGTKNNMKARSIPTISLAPSNQWGGHYFMSLITGKRVHAYKWFELPINDEVIARIHELATQENQPKLIDGYVSFEWGLHTDAETNDTNETHDENLPIPSVRSDSNGGNEDGHEDTGEDIVNTDIFEHRSGSADENDDESEHEGRSDPADSDPTEDEDLIEKELLDKMMNTINNDNEGLLNDSDLDDEIDFFDNDDHELINKISEFEDEIRQHSQSNEDRVPHDRRSSIIQDDHQENNIDIIPNQQDYEVIEDNERYVNRRPRRANAGTGSTIFEPTWGGKSHLEYKKKCLLQRKREERNTDRARVSLLMRGVRNKTQSKVQLMQMASNHVFLSAQMSASKGMKLFGERAIAAIIKECEQLDKGAFPDKPVVEPMHEHELTNEEKKAAMNAVSLIKEKRCGKLKARICADGSKQKRYLDPDESIASPTSSNEGTIASFMIDAYERRTIAVLDIPGAYLHAGMKHNKRRVLMKLRGVFVDLMCKANPKYKKYVCYENGMKTLYLKLLRALYGCIESALLWYELFTSKLQKMGFALNAYDKCVANKVVNEKQCTILWYVDDVKVSHVDRSVVEDVIANLEQEFGSVNPTYGNDQEYLGMKLKIDSDRKLHIDMRDQVSEIIQVFSGNVGGSVSSPANRNLMKVDNDSPLLSKNLGDEYHSTVAKLLYLEKRARPDLEPAVAFLSTRVSKPSQEDWTKLERTMCFLNATKGDVRVIGCDSLDNIFTWVDASFAVHNNMRSHTGGAMSFGWGVVHAKSSKQKLNTKSSTEEEVVGLSEYLPYNIWFLNFLDAQGYTIKNNIVYQDNQSAMRMEKNGRNSCTGNSRHIHIKYFFVKDRVDNNELKIQYCPTAEMLADFFTKPLQGALFKKFRDVIMGWKHINTLHHPTERDLKERVGISNVYNIVSSNSARDKVVEKVQFNLPPKIEHTDQSTNENMMSRVLNGSKQTNDKLLKNVSLI